MREIYYTNTYLFVNIYALNMGALTHTRQILTDLKETDTSMLLYTKKRNL